MPGNLGALLVGRRAIVFASIAAASVAVGALMSSHGPDQPAPSLTPAVAAPAAPATLLVFVSGAVSHPGLYELATGARIADAIADAGGILPSADAGKIPDLAALVHDGKQVNVPFAKGSGLRTSVKFDANSASAAELEEIPGVTADIAAAIVQVRTDWGPFASLSDLRSALGLDTATATLVGKHLAFLTDGP